MIFFNVVMTLIAIALVLNGISRDKVGSVVLGFSIMLVGCFIISNERHLRERKAMAEFGYWKGYEKGQDETRQKVMERLAQQIDLSVLPIEGRSYFDVCLIVGVKKREIISWEVSSTQKLPLTQ